METRTLWERFCDWCSWNAHIVVIIITVILSICVIAGGIKYQSRFYYNHEPMIIEVTDKRHWTTTTMVYTGKIMIPQTHHHYSISSDEHEMSVDRYVYESTEIGDRIVVDCIYKYLKKDNSLVDIIYEYDDN